MLGGLNLEPADFHRQKPLLLLAYLAVEGSKEKRHLYELFWQGAADPATSLRMALSQLRKVSPELTRSDERTVGTRVENDLAVLQKAIAEKDAPQLEALYRGEFLQGFSLPDWGAELEEWVYSTREFIAARVRATYIRVAEAEAAKGAFALAAQWAEKAYGLGRQDPQPEELERLYPLLVAGDSVLRGEVIRQAGEFGLELNLSPQEARERYFSPNVKGTPEPESTPHNLPRSKTSFIGRDPELVELGQLIGEREVSLITLLGPGGIGKTRLALQLALGQLQEATFPGGIYFVPLEALSEPTQIPLALAQVLGLKVSDDPLATVKAGIGHKQMLLILDNFEHLVEGALLVSELLQSCPQLKLVVTSRERLNLEEEHLLPLQGLPLPKQISFAEAEYVDAIRLFMQRAKRVRIDFALNPQNLPAVLEICRLVDGSPLGLELAAVWLGALPVTEIAAEIGRNLGLLKTSSRNIPSRHQSIQATFEYSWRLLRPKEQLTLARLSAFRGGFTREAASAVADSNLALLSALVDKSLLRMSESGRYDFHPLLHQFASEKLKALPEERLQTRAKQAQHFLALAEASSRDGLQAQIKSCQLEYENLLLALAWFQEFDQGMFGLRLGIALGALWQSQGYNPEGLHWLKTLLSHPEASAASPERFQALLLVSRIAMIHREHSAVGLAYGQEALRVAQQLENGEYTVQAYLGLSLVAQKQQDWAAMQEYGERGLALARKIGHPGLIANALWLVGGNLASITGDYVKSRQYLEESLSLNRRFGSRLDLGHSLANLGFLVFLLGDLPAAKAHLEEALRIAQQLPDLYTASIVQDSLSAVMQDLGDLRSAQSLALQALKYSWKIQNTINLRNALENLASLAVLQGQPGRAAQLWGVARRFQDDNSSRITLLWSERNERFMDLARTQLGEAGFAARWQEGQKMGLGEAVQYALGVTSLAVAEG
jgi:predicted ATPase